MKEILVDQGFVPGDVKEIIVGPANDRPGAVKLGNNQSIPLQEEAEAFQPFNQSRATGEIPIVARCVSIGYWDDFKSYLVFKPNSLIC